MSKGLLFTYLITMIGGVCGILNPFVALCAYIMLAILNPPSLWYFSVPERFIGPVGYAQVVGFSMLAGWILAGFGRWNFGSKVSIILFFWGFNFVWMFLSGAMNGVMDFGAWDQIKQFMKLYLALIVGITLVDSIQKLKILIWVVILSEGYIAFELNLSYMEGFDRLAMVGFAGMDNNFFAVTMVISSVVAFYMGLYENVLWRKGLAFFVAAMIVHVICFSMSRGAMLSLLISGAVIFWFIPKKPSYMAFFALAVIAGLYMAGPSVRDRFISTFADKEDRDASSQGRLASWKNCLSVMRDNPVFGIGLRYWLPYTRSHHSMAIEAHSMWMQAAAEQGVPGLLSLMGIFGFTCYYMIKLSNLRTPVPDPFIHIVSQMVLCALVGFAIGAQFVSLFALEISYYVVMFGVIALKFQHLYENAVVYQNAGFTQEVLYYRYE